LSKRSAYVLESREEFERLEKQSATPAYDYREELAWVQPLLQKLNPRRILDAGCGSGIVSRYLAEVFAEAEVVGCDGSEVRMAQARDASMGIPNLAFQHGQLESLGYKSNHFDFILCRFVLEHMSPDKRLSALKEMARCLRPGGLLCVIDVDGLLCNVSPVSAKMQGQLDLLSRSESVDLFVGRKIPALLAEIGLKNVDWDIQARNFRGTLLQTEITLTQERFELAHGFFVSVLGSEAAARQFKQEYLKTLRIPGCALFYNLFTVVATKDGPQIVK